MPQRASTIAGDVDGLFNFILGITVFFFVLILVLMVIFVVKYRCREGRENPDRAPAHSTALELTWTIIPTVLVLMIFYFGFRGYLRMAVAPPNSYEIQVYATMWSWSFEYPNGYIASELHVPVNTPIRLVLSSNDVIHSFFVPQFRVKKDAVPGRYNRAWFEATQLGEYDIFCAEYCGQNHSKMLSKVVVHDSDGFKKWLEEASNWETRMTPLEAGKMLIESIGCVQCHTTDGTTGNGPSFKDLFGYQRPLADGSTVTADENYIAESLYEPGAKVVRGYTVQMSSYRSRLKDKDTNAIITYMKSISVHHKSELPTTAPATTQPQ